jgi:hypothetical protein
MPRRPQHRCTICRRLHDGTGRCPTCTARTRATTDRARGTTTQRGYGAPHQHTRDAWAPIVATGTVPCTRCHHLIQPDEAWHLDHDDDDRTRYRGPAHKHCNLAAGGARRAQLRTIRATPGAGPPARPSPS